MFILSILFMLSFSTINCAHFAHSIRQVTSPYTSKTYILHNSRSSSTHHSASLICESYPNAKLASLAADSGDIEFLGRYIESLEEPYWIGDIQSSSGSVSCAALFAGGAVAIPKPSSPLESPCDTFLNVLCELN